ncbi:EamA family transporter [Mycetohabitans endofungorum]|uniref:EamA family transporter n=1 Tax=Mycetohabitans endofungorum TaxID=417203 RepID=UPI0030CB8526
MPIISRTARLTPLLLLCLLVTYVVWGTTYFAISVALRAMPPFMLMASRFAVAGLCLGLFVLVRGRARASWRQVRNGSMLGALMLLGGMGGTAVAEQTISSGATTVMIAAMPIVAIVWQRLFGIRPRGHELAAIAIGTVGVLVLMSGAEFRTSAMGAGALLLAISCWSLGTQLSRSLDLPPPALAVTIEMLVGSMMLAMASALSGESLATVPRGAPLAAWLYLVTMGSLLAFSAYMYLASRTTPVLATSYGYANPPIALLVGAALGGERIAPQTLVAIVLILCALAVLGWGTWRQPVGTVKDT